MAAGTARITTLAHALMTAPDPTACEWSDAFDPAADALAPWMFDVRVVPDERGPKRQRLFTASSKLPRPTRIILDGACPRCSHPMTSIHPVRGALEPGECAERLGIAGSSDKDDRGYRLIATQCGCAHTHEKTPEGEQGCGVPFAVGVTWPDVSPSAAQLLPAQARRFELEDERDLQETLAIQLAQVRKAAESWRTGLGAFLGILVVVFFVKGKTSFDALRPDLRWILGALLVVSAVAALYGAYRAVRAAFGTPADEYTPGGGKFWTELRKKLRETTPRHIHDYHSVGAWRDALAGQSVTDLRHAKVATVVSASAFIVATLVTWSAPSFQRVVVGFEQASGGSATACGKTATRIGDTLRIDGADVATRIPMDRVVSVKPVSSCPAK